MSKTSRLMRVAMRSISKHFVDTPRTRQRSDSEGDGYHRLNKVGSFGKPEKENYSLRQRTPANERTSRPEILPILFGKAEIGNSIMIHAEASPLTRSGTIIGTRA
jgi:hypothetical protein